jgi:hypothetical protein
VNVLSIDLDFFLEKRPRRREVNGRLSQTEYIPWTPCKVESYLENNCKLRKNCPIPGKIVTYHHEFLDLWKGLIDSGQLEIPFRLVHIDSHADMGMGDCSTGYIQGKLLCSEPNERYYEIPRDGTEGLKEGNFLTFAIACRWISSLVYVRHPDLRNNDNGHDIADCLFRKYDQNCGSIQLKQLTSDCIHSGQRFETFEILDREPEIPIKIIDCNSFVSKDSFSFIFVSQSPNYTPETSDSLFNVFRQFIDSDFTLPKT